MSSNADTTDVIGDNSGIVFSNNNNKSSKQQVQESIVLLGRFKKLFVTEKSHEMTQTHHCEFHQKAQMKIWFQIPTFREINLYGFSRLTVTGVFCHAVSVQNNHFRRLTTTSAYITQLTMMTPSHSLLHILIIQHAHSGFF